MTYSFKKKYACNEKKKSSTIIAGLETLPFSGNWDLRKSSHWVIRKEAVR